MVLTFAVILFGIMLLFRSLQRNPFYILNSSAVIGIGYWLENFYFKATPFALKTILLLIVIQLATINITTFIAYFIDKRAAVKGAYRVPEQNLHTLELLGGTFGALLGQKFLHHKSKKKSYQSVFFLIVIFQLIAVVAILKFLNFI